MHHTVRINDVTLIEYRRAQVSAGACHFKQIPTEIKTNMHAFLSTEANEFSRYREVDRNAPQMAKGCVRTSTNIQLLFSLMSSRVKLWFGLQGKNKTK